MTFETDLDEGVSRLETPISVDSLLNGGVAEFAIRSNDILDGEEDTRVEAVYPHEKLEPFLLGPDDGDDEEISITQDFEKLSKRMTTVREDGKVKKRIDRPGRGGFIPEDGEEWTVYVHYAVYTELADYPYDATRLRRKKPVKLRLDRVIPGLSIAIKSMRKGEIAKFLVHPDLAYKESGVPPRIPANATLLFDIELFDYCEPEPEIDVNAAEEPETYLDRIRKARTCRERGNNRKKQERNVNGAISQYRKGIFFLVQTHMANEEEEEEVRNELIKLYTNLAVSYMAKQDYRRTCSAYNDAMHDCPAQALRNAKLHYISAKALRFLGSYAEAKNRIRKANKLKPGDNDILKEMTELEETIKKYDKEEKQRAMRMFGFFTSQQNSNETEEDTSVILNEVDDDFKEGFDEFLDEFLADETKTVDRMNMLSISEATYCMHECRRKNIRVTECKSEGNRQLIFHKRLL